jgi:hypothetical protein
LLAVAAAVLVFAAPAAAEVRTWHANAPEFDAEPGEADIVAASASSDTSTTRKANRKANRKAKAKK